VYVATGILVVALVVFIVLRFATKLVKFLGVNGLHAMTKIMGFIILCVGVQFIIHGALNILTGEEISAFIQKVNTK
jgi:multiple antibiotic resistance protein